MFKTMTDFITWTTSTTLPKDEFDTWEIWQNQQLPTHYEKSDIFQYYLSVRPRYCPPRNSCINDHNHRYYVYCFGDFSSLIVNPLGYNDIIGYIILLLDIYDVCKGFSRRLKGDPNCIALLREVIRKRSIDPILKHDLSQYDYPYNRIHAHTVAQYSLSTLLMKFIIHYLASNGVKGNYSTITLPICQTTYNDQIFGAPKSTSNPLAKSSPININQNAPSNKEMKVHSWPQDQSKLFRCKVCTRVTENIWGDFDACMDCHLKRICSICGVRAVIIATDGLPKCIAHQE